MAAIEDDGDELQPDVIRVLDRYDNQYDRLVDLLTGMLGHREQWMGHLLDLKTENGFDRAWAGRITARSDRGGTPGQPVKIIPDALLAELPRYLNYALTNGPADEANSGHCLKPAVVLIAITWNCPHSRRAFALGHHDRLPAHQKRHMVGQPNIKPGLSRTLQAPRVRKKRASKSDGKKDSKNCSIP